MGKPRSGIMEIGGDTELGTNGWLAQSKREPTTNHRMPPFVPQVDHLVLAFLTFWSSQMDVDHIVAVLKHWQGWLINRLRFTAARRNAGSMENMAVLDPASNFRGTHLNTFQGDSIHTMRILRLEPRGRDPIHLGDVSSSLSLSLSLPLTVSVSVSQAAVDRGWVAGTH